MSALDIIQHDGEFVVTSQTVAVGADLQHASVLRLIDDNRADFDEFGQVRFEIRPGYNNAQVRIALLNEQQATLLMTFQRNTEQVRTFKKALVKAFFELARQTSPALPQSYAEALRELAATVERSAELEAANAELTPRAEAWDELASADGDYAVADAAKILARAGVQTGPQRLFEQLRGLGWIHRAHDGKWRAYAAAVDKGYLTEKPQSHYHPRTSELVLDAPQVRVTVRGLERLRVRLGAIETGAAA